MFDPNFKKFYKLTIKKSDLIEYAVKIGQTHIAMFEFYLISGKC
jgi:hypothetical protein